MAFVFHAKAGQVLSVHWVKVLGFNLEDSRELTGREECDKSLSLSFHLYCQVLPPEFMAHESFSWKAGQPQRSYAEL